jgi:serine/threonine-protein phosphatase 2B catalytic subunit
MSSSTSSESHDESSTDNNENDEAKLEAERKAKYTKEYNLHEIKISTTERFAKEVELPVGYIMKDEEFWNDQKPNAAAIKEHMRREGRISKTQFEALFQQLYEILCAEDNLMYIDAPLTICGDLHGQYYDLLKLFEVGGDPSVTRYLFLGDYVDRGNFSVECVVLLAVYKVLYPNSFWLLRGNHECRHLTEYFTFKEECIYKYDISVYDTIMDTFDALPLCAILNKQFFLVHGGISPHIERITDIANINRFTEPVPQGPMCDLLWADPQEDFNVNGDKYIPNTVRGCSFSFSYQAVVEFLEKNRLLSVVRAHEAQDAGYKMHRKVDKTGFPSVITLFSAPNYLGSYGNKGAILRYENNVINIRQFNAMPYPYYLPGFMNVFAWSLPFVAEKLGDLLSVVGKLVDDEFQEAAEEEQKLRFISLKQKVTAVVRMTQAFKKVREERENILKAGSISPSGATLPSSLSQSATVDETLAKSKQSFDGVRTIDLPNEARPPESPVKSSHVPSPGSLQRHKSRDNIIRSKKSNTSLMEEPKHDESIPEVTPVITEEKV